MSCVADDAIWVIRSAGERTTELCAFAIKRLYPDAVVKIIQETPFSQAVRRGFEIGQQSCKQWTICIDADVIMYGSGLKEFLKSIDPADDYFCYQANILDKFIPIIRPAGNHVYNNKYAERAISKIPSEGMALRPESYMTQEMSKQGYHTLQTPFVIGAHDYGQWHLDVFKKSMLHVNKHSEMSVMIQRYWQEMATTDRDFRTAELGALAGRVVDSEMRVDKRFYLDKAIAFLDRKNVVEKDPIKDVEKAYQELQLKFDPKCMNRFMQMYKNPYYRQTFSRFTTDKRAHPSAQKKVLQHVAGFMIKGGNKIKSL